MGQSTISMVIFNSYDKLPEGSILELAGRAITSSPWSCEVFFGRYSWLMTHRWLWWRWMTHRRCLRSIQSMDWFKGKFTGKPHENPMIFMGKSMVSGEDFPLRKPIHWCRDQERTWRAMVSAATEKLWNEKWCRAWLSATSCVRRETQGLRQSYGCLVEIFLGPHCIEWLILYNIIYWWWFWTVRTILWTVIIDNIWWLVTIDIDSNHDSSEWLMITVHPY